MCERLSQSVKPHPNPSPKGEGRDPYPQGVLADSKHFIRTRMIYNNLEKTFQNNFNDDPRITKS
jgi:hypothetical protein